MGMQVHFDLRDVLRHHAVTLMSIELEGETTFSGAVSNDVGFNIVSVDDLPGHSCWADVAHNRELVNWLIDQRIPFHAS